MIGAGRTASSGAWGAGDDFEGVGGGSLASSPRSPKQTIHAFDILDRIEVQCALERGVGLHERKSVCEKKEKKKKMKLKRKKERKEERKKEEGKEREAVGKKRAKGTSRSD